MFPMRRAGRRSFRLTARAGNRRNRWGSRTGYPAFMLPVDAERMTRKRMQEGGCGVPCEWNATGTVVQCYGGPYCAVEIRTTQNLPRLCVVRI